MYTYSIFISPQHIYCSYFRFTKNNAFFKAIQNNYVKSLNMPLIFVKLRSGLNKLPPSIRLTFFVSRYEKFSLISVAARNMVL